jgi:hypothetical protein
VIHAVPHLDRPARPRGRNPTAALAQPPLKIGLVQGFTGPLEVYAVFRKEDRQAR